MGWFAFVERIIGRGRGRRCGEILNLNPTIDIMAKSMKKSLKTTLQKHQAKVSKLHKSKAQQAVKEHQVTGSLKSKRNSVKDGKKPKPSQSHAQSKKRAIIPLDTSDSILLIGEGDSLHSNKSQSSRILTLYH